MESLVKMLMTASGRDKAMRIGTYVSMIAAGSLKGQSAQKFGIIARQLGNARVVMRLFDDLPMLTVTLKYGLGSKDPSTVSRILSICSNLAYQLYFPLEKIAWLSEIKVLSLPADKWWAYGITAWLVGLVASILQSVHKICQLRQRDSSLRKHKKLESPDVDDSSQRTYQENFRDIREQMHNEYLNIIKNGADMMNAVNWMPSGFLWSGKFSTKQTGIFGTISSIVYIYQILAVPKPKAS